MNKILLIITREYITRVRKKSFLIMTFLGPLLITGLYGLGIWMVVNDIDTDEVKKVAVIDESRLFYTKLQNSRSIEFLFIEENFEDAKGSLISGSIDDYYGILHIPNITIDNTEGIKIYSNSQPNITIVNYIEKQLESIIEDGKLKVAGIDKEIIENIKTNIKIGTIKLTASGEEEESNAAAALGVGLFGALLIYFFIFLYGIQVMRGVLEEKTSRIVE
ncbi:MAG: ABC transporter permease, partial [Bacteroidia bacterium]|nr:ABC transporter permease [Bacteroidia bacterium]